MIALTVSPAAPLALPLARRLAARLAWVGQDTQTGLAATLPEALEAGWQIALGDFPGAAQWLAQGQNRHILAPDWPAISAFCQHYFPSTQPIYSHFADQASVAALLPGEYWLTQPVPGAVDIQGAPPEWALANALLQAGKRVALAESCSGGLLAARLTEIPGVSDCFGCALVTYGNPEKMALLGVREDTLARFGAVSEQTVREMALGALAHGDLAVAISGIAGPGGATAGKPVGTVCIAWALGADQVTTQTLHFPGDRQAVRYAAASVALGGLLRRL